MTASRWLDNAEKVLLAALEAAADHRLNNPSAWSPDGYLMRSDSACEHCGRAGLSGSRWCGLCGKLATIG